METQFAGMSAEEFTYQHYEETRTALLKAIHSNLTDEDKKFILSLKELKPDWEIYNFEKFPNIVWKLENLQKLKKNNPEKHQALYTKLKAILYPEVSD